MKVAIIGAGASGLTAIKCCLDEQLEPVCYEITEEIGGLWNYKEEVVAEQPSVMKSTVINTSKELMSFSDFPIPAEYPIFMHNRYVQKYFEQYAKQFNLMKYIKFQTEVVFIKKHKDFQTTGQWDVRVKDKVKGNTEYLIYDAVLICSGHHAHEHKPTFPGLDRFKGTVIHSYDYKHPQGYDDKRVVIIGTGNSGGDAAVELSHVATQVFLCTRRGTWIWSKTSDRGLPHDMSKHNRFMIALSKLVPGLISKYIEHGDVTLPSQADMRADIRMKKEEMSQRYVKSQRHTIEVDYLPFMDELAQLNECRPHFKRLFLFDPVLAMKCIFGPCSSYQYRLRGPGAWPGAREAIMTQWQRTMLPLKTRPLGYKEEPSHMTFVFYSIIVAAVFLVILSFFCGTLFQLYIY